MRKVKKYCFFKWLQPFLPSKAPLDAENAASEIPSNIAATSKIAGLVVKVNKAIIIPL